MQQITGSEEMYLPKGNTKPLIPLDEAEKLLLKGFVIELNKEIQELIWAIVFICMRHLPDLRTQPYFLKALESKNATYCTKLENKLLLTIIIQCC